VQHVSVVPDAIAVSS